MDGWAHSEEATLFSYGIPKGILKGIDYEQIHVEYGERLSSTKQS